MSLIKIYQNVTFWQEYARKQNLRVRMIQYMINYTQKLLFVKNMAVSLQ
jgi:hypothetical protein